MDTLQDPLFQALFDTAIPRIILKADTPNFTIITYNKAYEAATHTGHRDIKGKFLWEAFNPNEAGGEGGKILLEALTRAVSLNEVVHMPPFHYDIPSANVTQSVVSWWQLEIAPVEGVEGKADYLLITTYNITEQVLQRQMIEEGRHREQIT